jgi:hypothetical protein
VLLKRAEEQANAAGRALPARLPPPLARCTGSTPGRRRSPLAELEEAFRAWKDASTEDDLEYEAREREYQQALERYCEHRNAVDERRAARLQAEGSDVR